MRSDSRAKYRRLLLIYSLVIILPGVFLSILAYRGISGNRLAVEKISSDRLIRKSKYFTGAIEDSIDIYLESFAKDKILSDNRVLSVKPGSETDNSIKNGMILAAAFRETDKSLEIIDQNSLFIPDRFLDQSGAGFTEMGEQSEYERIISLLSYHIERTLKYDFKTFGKSRPNFVSHTQDSLSVLLVSKLYPEFNVVLLLNPNELLLRNIDVLEETTGFPNRIAWRLEDENGNELGLSPDFNPEKKTTEMYPIQPGTWTLQLQELTKSSFAQLWESGEQIFTIGFIFVVAAMALGLFLTIRSLTRDYRLSQLKSDFVSTVSHEFKSPLTSIRMMSERLANKRVKNEDRKQDYYNSMLAQSERLSHLVENILDFSRMDKGRKTYNFEACNINKLAREVVNYLLIRHEERGFDISLNSSEDPLRAIIDCQAIHQVLYNLIENAIKFSGDSRKIEVGFDKAGDTIKIHVRDFGIGISKKDRKRVFGQFYRSERASKEGIKGSGVGLSIVSEIIKAHNGNIELESELGKGSNFIVYLPVNQK